MIRNSKVIQRIEATIHLASPCNMNLQARSTASPWTTRKGKIDRLLTSFSSTVWATGWIRTLRAFRDLASKIGSKQLTWTRLSMDLLFIVGPLSKACLSCKVEVICQCNTIGRWLAQSWYHPSQLTTIYLPRRLQEAPWLTWSTRQLSSLIRATSLVTEWLHRHEPVLGRRRMLHRRLVQWDQSISSMTRTKR